MPTARQVLLLAEALHLELPETPLGVACRCALLVGGACFLLPAFQIAVRAGGGGWDGILNKRKEISKCSACSTRRRADRVLDLRVLLLNEVTSSFLRIGRRSGCFDCFLLPAFEIAVKARAEGGLLIWRRTPLAHRRRW